MSRKGWLLFIALCVIWGLPYLLIRVAVRELPPPALIFLRTAPAALLLVPLALHRRELRPAPGTLALGGAATPWSRSPSPGCCWRMPRCASRAPWRGSSWAPVPLIAAVLYRALGAGEQFDGRRIAGLLVGFAGVAALVGIDVAGSDPLAVAEMLVVAVCYASGPLIISRPLAGLPTLGVITASLALTAVALRAGGPADHAGVGLGADGGRRRHLVHPLHRARFLPVLRADRRSGAFALDRDHLRQPARGRASGHRAAQRTAHTGHRGRHAAHPSGLGAGHGPSLRKASTRPSERPEGVGTDPATGPAASPPTP